MNDARVALALLATLVAGTAFATWRADGADPVLSTPTQDTLPPGLQVKIREERFVIHGSTRSAAMDDLAAYRLPGEARRQAAGLTEYRLSPQWRMRAVAGTCVITRVSVGLDIVVHLPEWAERQDAPPQDRDAWNAFIEEVTAHEYAHRDRTLAVAGEILHSVQRLDPGPCRALEAEADRVRTELERELLEWHSELDRNQRPPGLEEGRAADPRSLTRPGVDRPR